jgi:7-cyano-7-deazaguanine synthase
MKAVVVYSGGMDSLTSLYWALKVYEEVKAISFNYGQKHSKELDYAKEVCKELGIEHKVIDISFLKELTSNSSLTGSMDIPEGYYTDENMKSTVVSNRNAIFLNVAIAWACNLGYNAVVTGVHSGDHAIYPDCRKEFIYSASTTSLLATKGIGDIEIIAPFVGIDKSNIVKMGDTLGVDYSKSWSCYKGGELHCGKCGTCTERIEAFELAEVKDPTLYDSDN